MAKPVKIVISADSSGVRKGVDEASKSIGALRGLNKSVGASTIAAGAAIGAGISAAFSALNQNIGAAVSRLDTLNNFPKMMANLGISTDEGTKSVSYLAEKLKGLPTALDTAAMSVQRFASANGSVKASTAIFEALNNAILAGGAPMHLQQIALEQLSQAYTKGRPDMLEWRSALAAMPAQLKQVAVSMGYANTDALRESLVEGKVSMNQFMGEIIKLNQQGLPGFASFEEQAKNTVGGVGTALVNLRNAFVRAMADIMNAVGQANIASFFTGIANAIDAVVPYVVAFVKLIAWAVGSISALFGGKAGIAKSADGMKQSFDGAGKSLGGMAAGAGGVGKKLKGAQKEAKKLQGMLAGFDEMTVLKQPEPAKGSAGGAGAGGGGGGIGDLPPIELDWGNATKGADKALAIFEKMKKALEEMFDFKKIGAAIQRFVGDVRKFFDPVGRIIGDVWTKYLKPFLSWAGNSVLPAVLNAIGGALQLIGKVGEVVYFGFIKPFMDYFLVPIAKFAGDTFVAFLNALGDAMRGLAQNQGLVEFLVALTVAIAGLVIGIQAANAVQALAVGIKQMHAAAMLSPAVATSIVTSMGSMSAAFVLAGGGLAGLKAAFLAFAVGVKTAVIGAFTAIMAHPLILAIAGIAAGVTFLGGSIKSMFEQSAPSMWEAEARTKALGEANEKLKTAVQGVQAAEESLNQSRAAEADAKIAYTEAIKRQEEANAALAASQAATGLSYDDLKSKVDAGSLSYSAMTPEMRKVYDAGLALDSANAKVKTSQDAMTKSTNDAKAASEELKKKKDEEIAQRVAVEAAQKVMQGQYKNSAEAIDALKKTGIEWKDENGKTHKAAGKDIERLEETTKTKAKEIEKSYRDSQSGADQGFFGPMGRSLATAKEWLSGFATKAGEKFNEFKDAVTKKGQEAWDGLKNAWSGAKDKFSEIGGNVWEGLKSGLGDIAGKLGGIFSGVVSSVKSKLGIKSPSRVFKSIGKFIDEGLVLGVEGGMSKVDGAMERLTAGFNAPTDFVVNPVIGNASVGSYSLAGVGIGGGGGTALASQLAQEIVLAQASGAAAPNHIVLKIGEQTIVDTIIDGINDQAALSGMNGIRV